MSETATMVRNELAWEILKRKLKESERYNGKILEFRQGWKEQNHANSRIN